MAKLDPKYPADLIPRNGLVVTDNAPLAPNETREIQLDMTDAIWETERLTSLINDPDNRVGGLVFCFDDQNQRSIANLSGSIVPIFTELASTPVH